MDKPLALIQGIIPEDDKIYNATLQISIKQMSIGINTSVDFENLTTSASGSLNFTEIAVVDVPITISIAKNPNTIEQLITDSITFNQDTSWHT